jgi:hypothetical protein
MQMIDDDRRLRELCELTSKEQDPERLMELAAQLNELAREQKLQGQRKQTRIAG